MHIHILGIGGTFMSALAILAKEAGYVVTGCDTACYPPVTNLLKDKGIDWHEGYDDFDTLLKADHVIVGNAMKRGMPLIETLLNQRSDYFSGPQWLRRFILSRYRVIAVAGTHGKTTTTSMLAYILEKAGFKNGFLIGGVAQNLKTSAKLGEGEWFVIEADEYDSAFFDKRPKFMHYRPQIAILNNLEFDHADIYPNLAAIQQQFTYLIKSIPSNGCLIKPTTERAIDEILTPENVYSPIVTFGNSEEAIWRAKITDHSGHAFDVYHHGKKVAEIKWSLIGEFNIHNALAAMAASHAIGIEPAIAANSLNEFVAVKRRLEVKSSFNEITVYDDFAHHPTAIYKTISALKQSKKHKRIFVILEFASYTMRTGVHKENIGNALSEADGIFILRPTAFNLEEWASQWKVPHSIINTTSEIVFQIMNKIQSGDAIIVMSNRGFDGIHDQLSEGIQTKFHL